MTENALSFTIGFVLFQRQTNDKNVPRAMTLKIGSLGIYLFNKSRSFLFLQENWSKSRESITWLKTKKTLVEKQTLALIAWFLISLLP